jgi:hypothetical protein
MLGSHTLASQDQRFWVSPKIKRKKESQFFRTFRPKILTQNSVGAPFTSVCRHYSCGYDPKKHAATTKLVPETSNTVLIKGAWSSSTCQRKFIYCTCWEGLELLWLQACVAFLKLSPNCQHLLLSIHDLDDTLPLHPVNTARQNLEPKHTLIHQNVKSLMCKKITAVPMVQGRFDFN